MGTILICVASCDFVANSIFSGQTDRSTKSHEANTKLATERATLNQAVGDQIAKVSLTVITSKVIL